MKKALSVLLILTLIRTFGQNLVPNPSFEEYRNCPTELRQINLVEDWYSASSGTPEYFNCKFYLNAKAKSGEGLTAIIPYGAYDADLEYLSVKLKDTLRKGQNYCFEFYIQPDVKSPVLINKIGAYFSSEKIKVAHWNQTSFSPQIWLREVAPTGQWTKVSASFKAEGGEQYLTVGNFFKKEQINVFDNAPRTTEAWYAYYYLDDFSLVEVTGACNEDSKGDLNKPIVKNYTVYFESDEYVILAEEREKLALFINQVPRTEKIQLKLSGHTDSDASDAYNVELSLKRVEEVEQFLNTIFSFNTIKIWSGENLPLNNNESEEDKRLNRRVEITVIL